MSHTFVQFPKRSVLNVSVVFLLALSRLLPSWGGKTVIMQTVTDTRPGHMLMAGKFLAYSSPVS